MLSFNGVFRCVPNHLRGSPPFGTKTWKTKVIGDPGVVEPSLRATPFYGNCPKFWHRDFRLCFTVENGRSARFARCLIKQIKDIKG